MQRSNENSDLSEFYAEIGNIAPPKNHKNDAHSSSTTIKAATKTTTTNTVDEQQYSSSSFKVGRHQEVEDRDEEQEERPSDDNDDDYSSDDSSFSQISGFSEESGKEWKPKNKSMNFWLQKQMHSGANPRQLLSQILPSGTTLLAQDLHDMTLWRILASILQEPPRRQKLNHVNTLEDVKNLLTTCKRIIVLTGAGVSVSCGIPDFRSSDGIYSRLAKDFPDLPDPQAMFDIQYFSRDPRPFFKFAREIYPGQFKPSPCHRFIKVLEEKGKLLRNYTQNIDTLEQVAGIKNIIECHGSFSTAQCTKCKFKVSAEDIRDDIFAQRIPVCPRCQPNGLEEEFDENGRVLYNRIVEKGIMKPNIVFFGEGLPEEFHSVMTSDKNKCDLLIVIGSSLKVRPVALIPSSLPEHVPQILINREQLKHLEFDVELLGDSDVIVNQLCHMMGDEWTDVCWKKEFLTESKQLKPKLIQFDDDEEVDVEREENENSSSSSSFLQPPDSEIEATESESVSSFSSFYPRTGNHMRHLSVDSSKDSGICDSSSNSVPTPSSLLSPQTESDQNLKKSSQSSWSVYKKTVADRLEEGTFYNHTSTCSYVFPGAQVSFDSETEDSDMDSDGGDNNGDEDGDEDDEDQDEIEEEEDDEFNASAKITPQATEDEEGSPPPIKKLKNTDNQVLSD